MILTQAQKEHRARISRYVKLIGPMPCPVCRGTMMPELSDDEVGWQCILCPHSKLWNIPDSAGFIHLRPNAPCRKKMDEAAMARLHERFAASTPQIDIVREFGITRQVVAYLKLQWIRGETDGHSESSRDPTPHAEPQRG